MHVHMYMHMHTSLSAQVPPAQVHAQQLLCAFAKLHTCAPPLFAAPGKDHSKVLDEHVTGFVEKAKTMSAQVGGVDAWTPF